MAETVVGMEDQTMEMVAPTMVIVDGMEDPMETVVTMEGLQGVRTPAMEEGRQDGQ